MESSLVSPHLEHPPQQLVTSGRVELMVTPGVTMESSLELKNQDPEDGQSSQPRQTEEPVELSWTLCPETAEQQSCTAGSTRTLSKDLWEFMEAVFQWTKDQGVKLMIMCGVHLGLFRVLKRRETVGGIVARWRGCAPFPRDTAREEPLEKDKPQLPSPPALPTAEQKFSSAPLEHEQTELPSPPARSLGGNGEPGPLLSGPAPPASPRHSPLPPLREGANPIPRRPAPREATDPAALPAAPPALMAAPVLQCPDPGGDSAAAPSPAGDAPLQPVPVSLLPANMSAVQEHAENGAEPTGQSQEPTPAPVPPSPPTSAVLLPSGALSFTSDPADSLSFRGGSMARQLTAGAVRLPVLKPSVVRGSFCAWSGASPWGLGCLPSPERPSGVGELAPGNSVSGSQPRGDGGGAEGQKAGAVAFALQEQKKQCKASIAPLLWGQEPLRSGMKIPEKASLPQLPVCTGATGGRKRLVISALKTLASWSCQVLSTQSLPHRLVLGHLAHFPGPGPPPCPVLGLGVLSSLPRPGPPFCGPGLGSLVRPPGPGPPKGPRDPLLLFFWKKKINKEKWKELAAQKH